MCVCWIEMEDWNSQQFCYIVHCMCSCTIIIGLPHTVGDSGLWQYYNLMSGLWSSIMCTCDTCNMCGKLSAVTCMSCNNVWYIPISSCIPSLQYGQFNYTHHWHECYKLIKLTVDPSENKKHFGSSRLFFIERVSLNYMDTLTVAVL